MKVIVIYSIVILLISKTNSLLPPEKREELLSKYTKKISAESLYPQEHSFTPNNLEKNQLTFDYKVEDVIGMLETYNFPQNFSFIEQHKITPNVKNQGKCRSGWSHSATTALSYRFKLQGIDVDLSPQDALSCYVKDCDYENYLIDPQLNLIKNGTVTEQCLPFSSGEGTIVDGCPQKCKDGKNIKKYYSQNAYSTENQITKENYYQMVGLIIDQLISKGPGVSYLNIYKDFKDMHNNKEKCHNTIYRYDGKSPFQEKHAVTLVGYGLMDNKFYWLVQNSWGSDSCLDGFVKIEFGQIGVENVAFSEPYIEPQEGTIPTDVNIKYNNMKPNCQIGITYSMPKDLDNWKNTVEFNFESEDTKDNSLFNFQCGVSTFSKFNSIINCYFENLYYSRPKQMFKYKGYQSLGKNNKFILDSTTPIKDFTFYGNYTIFPKYAENQDFFVSEEGSKILFYFDDADIKKDYLPPIYANEDNTVPLSDCKKTILYNEKAENHNLVICNLKANEIDYFKGYPDVKKNLVYDIFCGYKQTTNTFAYKIDKTKYPVFKVKDINIGKVEKLSEETLITLQTILNGAISEDFEEQMFLIFTYIEFNNVNSTYVLACTTGKPNKGISEYNMTCNLQISKEEGEKDFNKLYFLPYVLPYYTSYPYEIYMKDVIKKSKGIDPDPTSTPTPGGISVNLKYSLMTMFLFVLLIL